MDAILAHELGAFSPRARAPHQRLPQAPDLLWLTVLLDESRRAPGPQLEWTLAVVRVANQRLAALGLTPGPFEVWLEDGPCVGPGVQGISLAFRDGISRAALSLGATPFCVAHEVGHFLAATTAPAWKQGQGAERVALLLLEEHVAQRVGIELLADPPFDVQKAVEHELHNQARQLVADYRATRNAFRELIIGGTMPSGLLESTYAFARTLAYLTGADAPASAFAGLPGSLRHMVSGLLTPVLAQIAWPHDLLADRQGLVRHFGLDGIVSDILSEVVSIALVSVPHARRHPDWREVFGAPRVS